jgi:hypothetical protein
VIGWIEACKEIDFEQLDVSARLQNASRLRMCISASGRVILDFRVGRSHQRSCSENIEICCFDEISTPISVFLMSLAAEL